MVRREPAGYCSKVIKTTVGSKAEFENVSFLIGTREPAEPANYREVYLVEPGRRNHMMTTSKMMASSSEAACQRIANYSLFCASARLRHRSTTVHARLCARTATTSISLDLCGLEYARASKVKSYGEEQTPLLDRLATISSTDKDEHRKRLDMGSRGVEEALNTSKDPAETESS